MAQRDGDSLRARGDAELSVNALDVVLDRVLTDAHRAGNMFGGVALGCQLQYLLFAGCQGVGRCLAAGAFRSRYW